MKLHEISAPVAALALLMAAHGDLPAATVMVTPLYPDRLALSFHDHPDAFQAWRAALGIDPATVTETLMGADSTRLRKATTTYGGATIELACFTDARPPAANRLDAKPTTDRVLTGEARQEGRAAEMRHLMEAPETEAAFARLAPGNRARSPLQVAA